MAELTTERLRLREWRPAADLDAFAAFNADPRVMEHFPARLTRDESSALIEVMRARVLEHGFGFWAVELIATGELIGCGGLNIPRDRLPFSPCVEIGWRLAHAHWGRGYAQELARAALGYGFETRRLEEIVSFTTRDNVRSRRVMEAIGMKRDPAGDFDHPRLAEGHPLRPHVLYRLCR